MQPRINKAENPASSVACVCGFRSLAILHTATRSLARFACVCVFILKLDGAFSTAATDPFRRQHKCAACLE